MILRDWMKSKGFNVVAGHSLITPQNYPPYLANEWNNEDDPPEEAIKEFDVFITQLEQVMMRILKGEKVEEFKLAISETDMSFPFAVRTAAREDMGDIFVDEDLCNGCGLCTQVCPYGAIKLNPNPLFSKSLCYGCWSCFNHCPSKAIYTNKVRGKGYYQQPTEKLKRKLGILTAHPPCTFLKS